MGCTAEPAIPDDEVTCGDWTTFGADRRTEFAKAQLRAEIGPRFTEEGVSTVPRDELLDDACELAGDDAVISNLPRPIQVIGRCDEYVAITVQARIEWSQAVYKFNPTFLPGADSDRPNALFGACNHVLATEGDATIARAAALLNLSASQDPALYEMIVGATPPDGAGTQENDRQDVVGTLTWSTASELGYTTDVVLDYWPLRRTGVVHPADSGFRLGSACGFDPDVDVWIPARIEITNTTSGFANRSNVAFQLQVPPSASPIVIDVESNFSNGTSCVTSPSIVTGGASVDLDEGAGAVSSFFIVLHDYYSPAHPDGDTVSLEHIEIVARAPMVEGDPITVVTPASTNLQAAS